MQIDTQFLETILTQAKSASRLAAVITDASNRAIVIDELTSSINEIVRMLAELLGEPHPVAAPVSSARQAIIDASLAVRTAIAHELGAVLGPHSKVMLMPSTSSDFMLAVLRRDEDDTPDDEPTETRSCPALPTRKQRAEDAPVTRRQGSEDRPSDVAEVRPSDVARQGSEDRPLGVESDVNKLRYRIARASALVLATETWIETPWGDGAEDRCRLEGLAHLVGAAGEALKAALDAADMIAAQLAKRTPTNPSYEA